MEPAGWPDVGIRVCRVAVLGVRSGADVVTAVTGIRDVTTCSLVNSYKRFGSVLAFGTQVRGFKPGRSRCIFQGEKILSTPSLGREVKPFVPCRIFVACKTTRKFMRGSSSFRSKLPAISRPSSSSFHYEGLWWRHLAVQVGTTKDQGVYNKPWAAVHPGGISRRDPITYIHT